MISLVSSTSQLIAVPDIVTGVRGLSPLSFSTYPACSVVGMRMSFSAANSQNEGICVPVF